MSSDREGLGSADRIIKTLLESTDHIVHHRPGMMVEDRRAPIGYRWSSVTWRRRRGQKLAYRMERHTPIYVGVINEQGDIVEGGQVVGKYRAPGIYPEAAAWYYRNALDVWTLDNEFAARWASYAFTQKHRDLKVVLAALMLVQNRCGEPVRESGELLFHDEDLRAVGEAMCLIERKDNQHLNPKMLLRIGQVLSLPAVADLNRSAGFGRSARKPTLGRWPKVVARWLWQRERIPQKLVALVNAGFRTTVMELARRSGYKPDSPRFFEILRWKQKQAGDGRRSLAIGVEVTAAETWQGLSEAQICQRIVDSRPSYKRIVGLLPAEVGLTRAIVAAAAEAGSLSDNDLVLLTPTLEEMDLLDVPVIGERWMSAMAKTEDRRAANIAKRVRGKKTAEVLRQAADGALQKAVEKVGEGLRVYVFVDISGSMEQAIVTAKAHISAFLQAFPLERLHVAVFNTIGREVKIRHASAAGVQQAFRNFRAGGGTSHAAGIRCLSKYKPKAGEDALFLFVGDQQEAHFPDAVRTSGISPVAFGFVPVGEHDFQDAVTGTARDLGIPCFILDDTTIADPYALPRHLSTMMTAAPASRSVSVRKTLIDTILETELLQPPMWARR
ncbi:MAG: vWA domain-containing protein [Myxococcota bacterium]